MLVRDTSVLIRQFEVSVVDGVDRGKRAVSTSEELSIGTAEANDLQLTDPSVSRHHCVLRVDARGLELCDLGSRNGTQFGKVELIRGYVQSGMRVRVGQTTLAVEILERDLVQPISAAARFGPLIGNSAAMRRMYPLIEQCASTTSTVLIIGETGTGKELVAEAIHGASDRTQAPFVVVACSALSHDLAESELFGHEEGAFTGATTTRVGVFESARGGTIVLDEIGDLPLSLQPLLLRVLENRTVRRIGSNQQRPIDVRVLAASKRDLRELVNTKRFRLDLYYRLHVLRVNVPPLRERTGDVALLATHFWHALRSDPIPPELVEQLAGQTWPGNVRELRNVVERVAQLGWKPQRVPVALEHESFGDAKERAMAEWERGWLEALINTYGGNLSRAARAARMGRTHLRELARKYNVTTRASSVDLSDDE